jgi:hypothetical protein
MVSGNESLFLGTGPSFDLGFAFAGLRKTLKFFRVSDTKRRINFGRSRGLARAMSFAALIKICGGSDAQLTGFESEDIESGWHFLIGYQT